MWRDCRQAINMAIAVAPTRWSLATTASMAFEYRV
jgi:hypothetical protein